MGLKEIYRGGLKRSTRRYKILAMTNRRMNARNRYMEASNMSRKVRKNTNNFRIKIEAMGDEKYFISKLH